MYVHIMQVEAKTCDENTASSVYTTMYVYFSTDAVGPSDKN